MRTILFGFLRHQPDIGHGSHGSGIESAIFFAEIGLGIPLAASTIGNVGMGASAIGMVASLAAGVIGTKFKAKVPIGTVLLLLIILAR